MVSLIPFRFCDADHPFRVIGKSLIGNRMPSRGKSKGRAIKKTVRIHSQEKPKNDLVEANSRGHSACDPQFVHQGAATADRPITASVLGDSGS